MRVLATSGAGAGHLGPLLPLVAALRARGDEVVLVVPEAGAAAARASGAEVVVSPDPPPELLADAWERFRRADPARASAIANGEIFGRLNTVAALPVVSALVRERRPQLVVHEAADYAGAIAAARAGVPHGQVAISVADAELGSLHHAAPELDRIETGVAETIRASPYLTRFPDALDPTAYPHTLRYRTGVVRNGLSRSSELPLVYVTFGTVASSVDGGADLLRSVLAALADLDVRVLVTTGRGYRPDLGRLGSSVRVEEWVAQDAALAEAAVVVCHGGSGTVLGAVAHGVPVVALPLFADQPTNAVRLAVAGAGLVVERDRTSAVAAMAALTAAQARALRHAVSRTLTDPVLRAGAARLASDLNSTPDVLHLLGSLAVR